MKAKIFLFHRISKQRDPLWDPMDPAHFNKVIALIAKRYTVLSLEELLSDRSHKPKKQACSIVFDDGYKDFLFFALPVLQKYSLPTCVCVITDCVQTKLPPWTYQVDEFFIKTKKKEIAIELNWLPEYFKRSSLENKKQRLQFARRIKLFMKNIDDKRRKELFEEITRIFYNQETDKNLMMDWDELRHISRMGIEIGSHTVSHPLLAKVDDEKEIHFQLQESFNLIREKIGKAPATIAYPAGNYNERVKRIAREAGYLRGLAVEQRVYDSSCDDIFSIPRIELYNEPMWKTKLRMNRVIEKLKKFKAQA